MGTYLPDLGGRQALRVAVVTETYPPEINGVARTVGLMVEALDERGHEIQLVRHLQIGVARPGALRKEWAKWRPDVVHVVTEGPLGWAAVSAAKSLGIPIVSD